MAASLFEGQGSFGNGAAMRVAPLGAYFADDLERVVEQARRSAEVTHAHPEGVAGAIGIAVAAAWAWRLSQDGNSSTSLIDLVLPNLPASEVQSRLRRALDEYNITGIKTTVPFHSAIMRNADFRNGNYDTGFVERLMNSDDFEIKPMPARLHE